MKINGVTYFALGAFVFVAACSKEAAEPGVYDWDDGRIYIRPSISGVAASRAQDMTLDRLESFQVTCFNSSDTPDVSSGLVSPYFENATFVRSAAASSFPAYVSSPAEGPRDWPANSGLMRFFAFSPSLPDFTLINTTTGNGTTSSVGYRLGNVRVDSDISRQFDFITAEAVGDRWNDFAGGVELSFSHQLCQVELRAWGDGSKYDFEIAGLRLGNPVVEGSFIFADDAASLSAGSWAPTAGALKDKVEYIYRGAETPLQGSAAMTPDRVYRINKSEHSSAESAASIMGRGGCAMVIPTVNERWEGTSDPDIDKVPYTTGRMYFAILTRVTDQTTGSVIYPYPGNPTGMATVSYALDSAGNILRRLYAGPAQGSYCTDPTLQQPYEAEAGVEVKDFGWAAVPVDADWNPGKRYVYTLDYSEGIGLHVPEDPEPGKPIAGKSGIGWGVGVETWTYAAKGDDYDPELNVPEY